MTTTARMTSASTKGRRRDRGLRRPREGSRTSSAPASPSLCAAALSVRRGRVRPVHWSPSQSISRSGSEGSGNQPTGKLMWIESHLSLATR
jgi:hypothetical protein